MFWKEKETWDRISAPAPFQDQMQQNLSKEAALAWSLIRFWFGVLWESCNFSWGGLPKLTASSCLICMCIKYLDYTCSKVRQSSPLTMTVLSRKLVLLTRSCRHHDSCGDCGLVSLLSLCVGLFVTPHYTWFEGSSHDQQQHSHWFHILI